MEESSSKLMPGARWQIFYNPHTETRLEGTATLIKQVGAYGELELWLVVFDNEADAHPRYVNPSTADSKGKQP